MTRKGIVVTIFSLALAFVLVSSLALADEFDEAMKLTFGQEVAIPGKVLAPGTYWFVRAGHGAEPNVIQVFDSERKNIITTMNTGTDQIVKPSGHVILSMADRSPKPPALISVTYPGRTDGHLFEISYTDQERKQFSEFPKMTLKVGEKGVLEKDVTKGEK